MNLIHILRIAHRLHQVACEDDWSDLSQTEIAVGPSDEDPYMAIDFLQLREQIRVQARDLAIHCPDINDPADFAEFVALWTMTMVPVEQHDRKYFERLERRIRSDALSRSVGEQVPPE